MGRHTAKLEMRKIIPALLLKFKVDRLNVITTGARHTDKTLFSGASTTQLRSSNLLTVSFSTKGHCGHLRGDIMLIVEVSRAGFA